MDHNKLPLALAVSVLVLSSPIAINTATSGSHTSDTTAQRVNPNKSNMRPAQKLSIDIGTSFTKQNASTDEFIGSSTSGIPLASLNGSDRKSVTSIGIDYRVPIALLFYNLGNAANLANAGNIGNIGNIRIRQQGPVAGVWGRTFIGNGPEVSFDFHPTPGLDTFLSVSRSFFLMPYLGYSFSVQLANNPADLTFFSGLRLERRKLKFKTNQGSGFQQSSSSHTDVGLTIGFDIDIPLPGLFNVGNAANTSYKPVPFFRAGAAYDFEPFNDAKDSVTTNSPTLSYANKSSGGSFRIFLGGGVKF